MTMLTLQATVEPDGRLTVNADDAAREIERLQRLLGFKESVECACEICATSTDICTATRSSYLEHISHLEADVERLEAENKELFEVRDLHWKRIAELEARVREVEEQRVYIIDINGKRHLLQCELCTTLDDRVGKLEQERDRLLHQVKQIACEVCFTTSWIPIQDKADADGVNTIGPDQLARCDYCWLQKHYTHLRGLIGALPAGTDAEVAGFRRSLTLGGWSNKFAEALAALLREK